MPRLAQSIGISDPLAFILAAARELTCGVEAVAKPSGRWPIVERFIGDTVDPVEAVPHTEAATAPSDLPRYAWAAVALLSMLDALIIKLGGDKDALTKASDDDERR